MFNLDSLPCAPSQDRKRAGEENWRRVVFRGPDWEQIELRG